MRAWLAALERFFETILLPSWMAPEWMSRAERAGFYITAATGLVFTLCYTYQFFYVFVALVRRPRRYPTAPENRRYAAVIAARNEERVIGALLDSIRAQTYPTALIDVFVVADNCTDATAAVARSRGATVFERQCKVRVGKGYALEFLFDRIRGTRGLRAYDAYLVFDADNILSPTFFAEMHKAFCAGNEVITSYRNSKNYGKSWVSAGYALWFMRESRHLQNPRTLLGCSAAISGTGFLVDSKIIEANGGWRHFLLTEDIEFTADCITRGVRIGYCHAAELFDEQPETFAASFKQRKRWARGMFQVMRHYGGRLFRGTLRLRWSCYDMLMNVMPSFVISTVQLGLVTLLFLADFFGNLARAASGAPVDSIYSKVLLGFLLDFFLFGYAIFLLLGFITMLTEWRKIHCSKPRALLLLLFLPFFMLSYIPISLAALFSKRVVWHPVEHRHAMTVSEVRGAPKQKKKNKKGRA